MSGGAGFRCGAILCHSPTSKYLFTPSHVLVRRGRQRRRFANRLSTNPYRTFLCCSQPHTARELTRNPRMDGTKSLDSHLAVHPRSLPICKDLNHGVVSNWRMLHENILLLLCNGHSPLHPGWANGLFCAQPCLELSAQNRSGTPLEAG